MMSRTFDFIAESLNELITDFETNDGKNLSREFIFIDDADRKESANMKWEDFKNELMKDPEFKREYDALEWMMDIDNIPLDPEYKAQRKLELATQNDVPPKVAHA